MVRNAFRCSIVPALVALITVAVLAGCGSPALPLDTIRQTLKDRPMVSVLLADMKTEGDFFKSYYHKYRIVEPDSAWTTEWQQVPESYFKAKQNLLGMTLFAKKDGEETATTQPPGYAFVGDSRYGQWRDDGRGGSFWEFYGKYALFSQFFGGWYRPIYRDDYDVYRHYRSSGKTYYGRNREYGSAGTVVRKQKPNFYARRMAGLQAGKQSFTNKVSARVGRTRTGFRGRSGGRGK